MVVMGLVGGPPSSEEEPPPQEGTSLRRPETLAFALLFIFV